MSKLSEAGYRFPAPAGELQVNFCKNIRCAASGVPEILHRTRQPPGEPPLPGTYTRHGPIAGSIMRCGVCKEFSPYRSNAGILEEMERLAGPLVGEPAPSCRNEDCDNFNAPVTELGLYAKFGKTRFGTPRWRCKACRITFSGVGAPNLRQRITHRNRDVFMLLVNKAPLRRIMAITGLSAKTVYRKSQFIHEQCQSFAGHRERALLQGMALPDMDIAVDRQTHFVNWRSRTDRRNVSLQAIGSADLNTGYVFGFHLNYDGTLDVTTVEADAEEAGDFEKPEAFRKYARLWLSVDHEQSLEDRRERSSSTRKAAPRGSSLSARLQVAIENTYTETAERQDIEDPLENAPETALPWNGMQVRQQYTMHAHFQLLAQFLRGAPRVRIYMDQDSGIRAAFIGAFIDRIKDRTANGWYVRVLKETTVIEKEKAVAQAAARRRRIQKENPSLSQHEVLRLMMREEMARARKVGRFEDRWLQHPQPHKGEPSKELCWLTDLGGVTDDEAAELYLRGSLHAIDRFFMQTRRMLSMGERAIGTASKAGRIWYGYSAYDPQSLVRALEIFRVFYNFCKPGQDGKTPAMRLGLAAAVIDMDDILRFKRPEQ